MINSKHYTNTQNVLLEIAGIVTIIPLAPFLNRFIPPVVIAGWNLDLLISVGVSFILIRLILKVFKPLIIPALALLLLFLVINIFKEGYSFSDVIQDYRTVVISNWGTKDTKQADLLNINPGFFESYKDKTARGIRSKIDYKDSLVRNYSVQHSLDYFDEYFNKYKTLTRHLSLFKYLNQNFKYVSDAQRDEYFASAKETILNGLGGDCDDHSILMATCLKSIGARCRIVLIEGHAYPELYCGNKKDFQVLQQAIVHLFNDQPVKEIYYHANNGEYWINLDYTASHPGGRYLNNLVYATIEL